MNLFRFTLNINGFFLKTTLIYLYLTLCDLTLDLYLTDLLFNTYLLLYYDFTDALLNTFLYLTDFTRSTLILNTYSFYLNALADRFYLTALLHDNNFNDLTAYLLLNALTHLLRFCDSRSISLHVRNTNILALLDCCTLCDLLLLLRQIRRYLLFTLLTLGHTILLSTLIRRRIFLSTRLLRLLVLFIRLRLLQLRRLTLDFLPQQMFTRRTRATMRLNRALHQRSRRRTILRNILS